MIRARFTHPVCAFLITLLAAQSGFGQVPSASPSPSAQVPPGQAPAAPPVGAIPAPAPAPPKGAGTGLGIVVLEGNNSINSTSLGRSVAATVEIRDSNDFPVEDATVTFTLPAVGTGGTFAPGGRTFQTRSDARGQAIAPFVVPVGLGKFRIAVSATAGDRKGEGFVTQTNSAGSYVGPPLPPKPWYLNRKIWLFAGAGIVGIILLVELRGGSKPVVITPGTPVFAP
jgi:hypothetical protein